MARYLVVTKKENHDVEANFHKQLLDGVAAANMLFGDETAEEAKVRSAALDTEKVSVVLELHGKKGDAFVFRVPQLVSKRLIFSTDGPLMFVGAKRQPVEMQGLTVKPAIGTVSVAF